ncbi:MAG: polysaccharide export outer membrane protein, partial [Actinobacteria bacterium]|nr:polysaccharide export outer membrane protein [Actinomycetota bacterium]
MKTIPRVLSNVPVLRVLRVLRNVPVLMVAMVMAGVVGWIPGTGFLGAALPAFAAAEITQQGLPDIPTDVTPEQIDAGKKMLETSAEARKMLEDRKKLADTAKELQKKGDKKEIETTKQEQMTKVEPRPAFPAYDWKTSTYVGNLFLKRLVGDEAGKIIHFGHEIFNPVPGVALILENMPVAPGYVVGPGDEIVIRMWGRVEGTQRAVVDRDGKIYLSKFGSLYVAGKTFDEMKSFLKSKISTIAEVSSDVTMGQMKGIRVSAVGEVRAPGWYNVSSLHTALQALSMAGGVKDIGTLRRIRINRGGNEIQEIDLYDYLLKGETRSDIRLIQGDAIFVPVVGRLVAISGEVRRPAIYELKDEKTLLDLIRVSGGFAPTAYKRRIQVERLEGHTAKIVLDADADELEKGKGPFELSDGDIVRVLPILGPERNAVTLEGNVLRPGKYELKPGMTVASLLPDIGSFQPETWFDYAQLTRLVPPEMRKETIPVNLREIVLEKKKEADVPLQAMDILTVFPRSAFRDSPKVTISGEVRKAGSFDLKKGARISDLVKLAGDLTRSASTGRSEILRIDGKRNFQTIYFDLAKAMSGDAANDLVLEDEDQVKIHSIWETRYKKSVSISGEVNSPGEYVLTEGMKISDLLFRAGGFKESAYGREAELIRREIAPGGELVKTETLVFSPERAMSGDKSFDIPLREYDLLAVRQIPDWAEKIQVTLAGEVRFPGAYAVRKGERLSSVIERAGGFTTDAYIKAAQFTRISTQKTQQ